MRHKTSLLGAAGMSLALALALGTAAQAEDFKIVYKGAPQIEGSDGDAFKVRGRLLVDGVWQNWHQDGVANDLHTGNFRDRQAFLGVEGKINPRFAYKVEGGAVNGGGWSWDDAIIEFKPTYDSSLIIGHTKTEGLENVTSTRFLTFMERGPYANLVGLDFKQSVALRWWSKYLTLTASIQGDSLNTADNVNGKELFAQSVRAVVMPINDKFTTVHLAGWYRHRSFGETNVAGAGTTGAVATPNLGTYSFRPNVHSLVPTLAPYTLRNTGAIATEDNVFGLEGLVIWNQFSVQSEWTHLSYKAVAGKADDSISTGYVFVSFWPTGERRNYNNTSNEIGRPKINHPLVPQGDGWGGLELAVRYDWVDMPKTLATTSANLGDYHGWTLGANWYPNSYYRLMLNYTDGKQTNPVANTNVKAQILQVRAQVDW
jgi:phosphate-selective porin OprO/OprP